MIGGTPKVINQDNANRSEAEATAAQAKTIEADELLSKKTPSYGGRFWARTDKPTYVLFMGLHP